MRRASLSLVPPDIYRHFAAVTLALTTALAMFADGENREAKASQIAERQPAPEQSPASFAIAQDSPVYAPVPNGWYYDASLDETFGQPMQRLFDGGSSSVALLEEESVRAPDYEIGDAGALNASDRKELLRQLRESRAAPPADGP